MYLIEFISQLRCLIQISIRFVSHIYNFSYFIATMKPSDDLDVDIVDFKPKTKKKAEKQKAVDQQNLTKPGNDLEEVQIVDFKDKKKKEKADKKAEKEKALEQENKQAQIAKRNQNRYKLLLKRIQDTLTKNNPDLAENTKILLKPPKVERLGSKKTAIINFISLCKQLDRHPEHIMNFFLEDLGNVSGAIGNSGLVIKTVLNLNNVENLFRKYISQYVQCQLCRRQNTELIKDERMRLWNLHCNSCKSSRSVRTIKGAQKKYSDFEAEQQNEATPTTTQTE